MLDNAPTKEELVNLIGENKYSLWVLLCEIINSIYDMDCAWNAGGKAWTYEYKYSRGGKTLCALYAKKDCFGFMIIFGKAEREKFEADRDQYSMGTQQLYDNAKTYHDGKWMMFEPETLDCFDDFRKLLAIKRKPNKKV